MFEHWTMLYLPDEVLLCNMFVELPSWLAVISFRILPEVTGLPS